MIDMIAKTTGIAKDNPTITSPNIPFHLDFVSDDFCSIINFSNRSRVFFSFDKIFLPCNSEIVWPPKICVVIRPKIVWLHNTILLN